MIGEKGLYDALFELRLSGYENVRASIVVLNFRECIMDSSFLFELIFL